MTQIAGTLTLQTNNDLSGADVTIGSSTTLSLSSDATLNSLVNNGTVSIGANILTVSTSFDLDDDVNGTGTIIFGNGGTLSGNNFDDTLILQVDGGTVSFDQTTDDTFDSLAVGDGSSFIVDDASITLTNGLSGLGTVSLSDGQDLTLETTSTINTLVLADSAEVVLSNAVNFTPDNVDLFGVGTSGVDAALSGTLAGLGTETYTISNLNLSSTVAIPDATTDYAGDELTLTNADLTIAGVLSVNISLDATDLGVTDSSIAVTDVDVDLITVSSGAEVTFDTAQLRISNIGTGVTLGGVITDLRLKLIDVDGGTDIDANVSGLDLDASLAGFRVRVEVPTTGSDEGDLLLRLTENHVFTFRDPANMVAQGDTSLSPGSEFTVFR